MARGAPRPSACDDELEQQDPGHHGVAGEVSGVTRVIQWSLIDLRVKSISESFRSPLAASSSSSRSRGSFPSALRGKACDDPQRPRHEHGVDQRAEFAAQILRVPPGRDDQRRGPRRLAFGGHEHHLVGDAGQASRSAPRCPQSEPRRPPILIMSASRPNNANAPIRRELDAITDRECLPARCAARTEVAPSLTLKTRSGYGVQISSCAVRRVAMLPASVQP